MLCDLSSVDYDQIKTNAAVLTDLMLVEASAEHIPTINSILDIVEQFSHRIRISIHTSGLGEPQKLLERLTVFREVEVWFNINGAMHDHCRKLNIPDAMEIVDNIRLTAEVFSSKPQTHCVGIYTSVNKDTLHSLPCYVDLVLCELGESVLRFIDGHFITSPFDESVFKWHDYETIGQTLAQMTEVMGLYPDSKLKQQLRRLVNNLEEQLINHE